MLIYFDASTGTALAFDRSPGDRQLTFSIEGEPDGVRTILVDKADRHQMDGVHRQRD